jgi:replicative DNA helicase
MNQPGSEARITNLEKEAMSLGARIEEAASDTAEELRAVRQDISANVLELKQNDKRLFDHVQAGFQQAHDFVQERFSEINTRLDRIESDVSSIKTTQDQILYLLQQKSGD